MKREGLIKPAEVVGFKAGKEYHRKTKRPNELLANDNSNCYNSFWTSFKAGLVGRGGMFFGNFISGTSPLCGSLFTVGGS